MTPDLPALLAKVKALTGPDREIGFEVLLACGCRRTEVGYFMGPLYYWSYPDGKPIGKQDDLRTPDASVDAALALVERVLPGQALTIGQNVHHRYWLCTFNSFDADGGVFSNSQSHAAPTPPLAILAALLTALIAKGEQHGQG